MSTRPLSPTRSIAILTACALGVSLASAAMAQNDIPRTPSGKPDFTGTYDIATLTPLTRPREFGDRLFLSPEEAEKIAEEQQARIALDAAPSNPDREAPPEGGAPPVGLDESFTNAFGAGNVGGYNNFWVDQGEAVFEIDGKFRTSIIEDPKNGQLPAWTPVGMAKMGKLISAYGRENDGTAWWLDEPGPGPYDDPESLTLADRCLLAFGSSAGPPMLPSLYNNHKRLVLTDDHLLIHNEMVHDARVVRIDGEHEPDDVRRWLGDAVAHWEGDTLVIETKNLRDETGMFAATRTLEVTERFSFIDGENLLYEFTVNDPTTWQQPWSGSYAWPRSPNKVYEYACHEGNYAMGGILRGARVLEQDAMKAKEDADSDD